MDHGRPFGKFLRHPRRLAALIIAVGCAPLTGEEIGSVDTKFKLIGPDHKIKIEAFDDEQVTGVACHLSRAVKGGISGAVGLAEDTADASIACRQVGPITFSGKPFGRLKPGDQVFSERRSAVFKRLQVVRFCDEARNTLVYLVYSDKVIDGSPQNSLSTVPLAPWPGTDVTPRCSDAD